MDAANDRSILIRILGKRVTPFVFTRFIHIAYIL